MGSVAKYYKSSVRALILGLMVLFSALSGAASAGSASDPAPAFHNAVSDAYGHYREAFFYLRRGNAMTAAFELEALVDKWHALTKVHASNPPPPYATDAQWGTVLKQVGSIAEKALEAAVSGESKAAYDELQPVRGMLRDLRERNGVRLFRDDVEDANATFRELFKFRRNPPDFDNPQSVASLRKNLAATISAYQACLDQAPADVAKDEQFQRLVTDSLEVLKRMNLAIEAKSELRVINILRRVVSSNNILWMRFG
ncbi:MAG: hypothetical protein HN889_01880 [Rhodospirillaceae bacterium]|nr:hypothetical protein [Rhodospirillaceae bacterium]